MQHGLIENYRAAVETKVGTVDPGRAMAGSDAHDLTMFRKVHVAGAPRGEGVKMEDYVFWLARKANCLLTLTRSKALQKIQEGKQDPSTASRA
jgi:hypothetical protein